MTGRDEGSRARVNLIVMRTVAFRHRRPQLVDARCNWKRQVGTLRLDESYQQAGEISASLMLVEYVFPTRRRRVSLAASDGELPAELSASPPGLRDAAQSALEMG